LQDASNPLAAGPFFNRPEDNLLEWTGYSGLKATKWVGKGNKGGCKLWFEW
jgi:hypothetical protein